MTDTTKKINVSDHLGLAHHACRTFRSMVGRGFDYDDLFQAACEGLLDAAKSYNPELGAFSTHALPLARRYVKRLVATQARTVKCPEYAQDRAAAAGRPVRPEPTAPRARRTAGAPFNWDAPGASFGGPALVATELGPYQGTPSTWTAPATGIHSTGDERSLDFTFGDDGGTSMHDVLSDDGSPSPESLVDARQLADWRRNPKFNAALGSLPYPERVVLFRRLEGDTLASIGRLLELTKARIHQLEAAAVTKIRAALGVSE